jgi:hypothetical protein
MTIKKKDNSNMRNWNYEIIYDDTNNIFQIFNKIYEKDRKAARYYISNKKIATRIIAFYDNNIFIIKKEQISYGVSVTLKRYKSLSVKDMYYVDMKSGLISKKVRGKFIPCKPTEISIDIKDYIIKKMKWIDFVFKLSLPITFTTIVNKKLYSERKLLSWFWGTNYKIALKFNKLFKDGEHIFHIKNSNNIKNINNINPLFFTDPVYRNMFLETLSLAIKSMRIINAVWSYKRLVHENKKMNRHVLDTLYETYNYPLKIYEKFLPIIKYFKDNNYIIPKTSKELSEIWNEESSVHYYLDSFKNYKSLIVKKNGNLVLLAFETSWKSDKEKIAIKSTYSYTSKYNMDKEIENDIKILNEKYESLVKIYERKNKIKKITLNENISEFNDIEFKDAELSIDIFDTL